MHDLLIVPDFSGRTFSGQLRLNELSIQAEKMTRAAKAVRASGFKKVTFEQVLNQLAKDDPAEYICILPEDFIFTGKRVIPSEEAFFKWYYTTAEGMEYAKRAERYAPNLAGTFARIQMK